MIQHEFRNHRPTLKVKERMAGEPRGVIID